MCEPHMLIFTDGYDIRTQKFCSAEEARKEMARQYAEASPEEGLDDTSSDMSYLGNDSAELYTNGENVYLWRIVDIA